MTRQQLVEQIKAKRSYLCVGLDTDITKIPATLLSCDDPIFEFNRAIIDATAPYCVAYKPNLAFYECYGSKGIVSLEKTVEYIRSNHPGIFIIADAKRGDIGNTSKMYAKTFFEQMDFDAVTVAPYMGHDSVEPFLGFDGKWVVLLALTSNKGSLDFQHINSNDSTPLYKSVMTKAQQWATPDELMFVCGATQAEMFDELRQISPRNFYLVPGVGAQGGSLSEVSKRGLIDDCGLLVNSSRGIIYASQGEDFAEAAGNEARKLRDEMSELLSLYSKI